MSCMRLQLINGGLQVLWFLMIHPRHVNSNSSQSLGSQRLECSVVTFSKGQGGAGEWFAPLHLPAPCGATFPSIIKGLSRAQVGVQPPKQTGLSPTGPGQNSVLCHR